MAMTGKQLMRFFVLLGLLVGAIGSVGCHQAPESPEPRTLTLEVAGMTCEGCEEAIVQTVGAMPGVQMVEADHVEGTATILADLETTSREDIVAAIDGIGYTVVRTEP